MSTYERPISSEVAEAVADSLVRMVSSQFDVVNISQKARIATSAAAVFASADPVLVNNLIDLLGEITIERMKTMDSPAPSQKLGG